MLKILACDFDGTLLPYGKKRVSTETIELIKKIKNKGIKFVVASGRTYSELKALLSEVEEDTYFVCDDVALTVLNGNVVFKKAFDKQTLTSFFDTDVFEKATLYSLEKAYLIGENAQPVLYGKTPITVKRHFEINDDIYKVAATVKRFDLSDTETYRVHYFESDFAEFVSAYANKGVAIADIQLKLGTSRYNTLALGDADNDISMMSHAKYSCAIGNASENMKKNCKYYSESVEKVLRELQNNI